MIVSRSLTLHPQSPTLLPLTIGDTVLKESDENLEILRVTFDSKMALIPRWTV